MATTFPETARTRTAWAMFWTLVRKPWKDAEQTELLAENLGPTRTAIAQWCTGADGRMGPWSMLHGACGLTGEAHPHAVPEILRKIGKDWFGVEVKVELADAKPLADFPTENEQMQIALGELLAARRSGDRERIRRALRTFDAESDDVVRAAELEAK